MTGVLAFLSTGETLARSPVADAAAATGASFESRAGWEIAACFAEPQAEALACRETVAWADVSHLRKYELQGPPAALDALEPLPQVADGLAGSSEGAWWCRVTSERALVLGLAAAPTVDRLVHVLDLTCQLGALRIGGPLARELFARLCALDLRPHVSPAGAFRPGSVAHTPGYVLCEAPERYLMLFGAAYGAYVWEEVCTAGTHLSGRPAGMDAFVGVVPADVHKPQRHPETNA